MLPRRREKNVTVEFAAALVILIGIGIISYHSTTNIIQASRMLEEKRGLLQELRDVREQVLEFEISPRDGNVIEKEIQDIGPLVAGDEEQQARLKQITRLAARPEPGNLNKIKDVVGSMEKHENDLLLRSMDTAVSNDRRTTVIIIVGSSIAFAFIAFAGILISLELIARRRKEKRLNFELRQLLSIFDGVDETVYVADPATYEVIYANQQILKNFGNVVGKKCHRVFQGYSQPCPFCTNDKIFGENTGQSHIWENRNNKDKRWYRCIDKAIPWPDGRLVRCEIAIDITEAKQAEERINALNKELEAFSYSVTHDLKIPLVVIGGFARNLAEGNEPISDKGREFLRIITTEVGRMEQLIEHLLEFSSLKHREPAKSPVNMAELAQNVFAEIKRTVPPDKEITFILRDMPPARGDAAMLREVFLNLFANAVKFTAPREKRLIETGGSCSAGENTYYVRDNGVGFDPRHADRIFECFQRLHGSKEFSGTGVGLAIVQRVVERHGGRVRAEGEPDKGAVFYFTLPTV